MTVSADRLSSSGWPQIALKFPAALNSAMLRAFLGLGIVDPQPDAADAGALGHLDPRYFKIAQQLRWAKRRLASRESLDSLDTGSTAAQDQPFVISFLCGSLRDLSSCSCCAIGADAITS